MKRLLIILLLFPAILQAQTTYPIRGISRVVYGGDTLDTKFSADSTKLVTNNKAFVFNKTVKVNNDTLATRAYARSVGGGVGSFEFPYTKTFHQDSSLNWYINPGKLFNIGFIGSSTALHVADDGVSLSASTGLTGMSALDAGQAYLFGETVVNLSAPYINIGESGSNALTSIHGKSINIVGESYDPGNFPERSNSFIIDSTKFFFHNGVGGDLVKIGNDGYIKSMTPHAHMQFMDSTVTIPLTQNVWYQITRQSARTTWPDSELVGFTSNGDSLIASVSGHYNITCKVNLTGSASKDYEYRIMKKTATSGSTPTEVWRYQVTGTGTRVLRDISSYINLNANERVWIELRSISLTPGNVQLHGGEFLINPVHLFL